MDARYDVAISFLSRDEPLAVKLYNELTEHLRVFVYSKRQKELAGTDGLESFRKTFLSDSKLVVVLYRNDWGKTRWTAIEEISIKERVFNGDWASLLFVMLDETSSPPNWLPGMHLRLSYSQYGDALIGAIKMRAQERGSTLKSETAMDRAARAQANELVRAERDRLLTNNGMDAVRREHSALRRLLDERIAQIQTQLTTIKLEHGSDNQQYVIRSEQVSVSFYLYITAPVTKSCIVIREFDAPLILPGDRSRGMYWPGEQPREISKKDFCFDYHEAHGWCWRQPGSKGDLLTTSTLAEYLIKRVFDLHEQFKAGGRVRHREMQTSYHRGGSNWMR